jgi:hypothetical protein
VEKAAYFKEKWLNPAPERSDKKNQLQVFRVLVVVLQPISSL